LFWERNKFFLPLFSAFVFCLCFLPLFVSSSAVVCVLTNDFVIQRVFVACEDTSNGESFFCRCFLPLFVSSSAVVCVLTNDFVIQRIFVACEDTSNGEKSTFRNLPANFFYCADKLPTVCSRQPIFPKKTHTGIA
jgi:hypothetical protein